MKKTLKTQLLAALSMLLVAAVALTGATYAWFTTVTSATVGNIDLYVKAADALLLSAYTAPDMFTASQWSAAISKAEIVAQQDAAASGINIFPEELINTSTLLNGTSHAFFNSVHSAAGALTAYEAATGVEYSRFTLWVKSTRDGLVYINNDSLVKALQAIGGAELTTEPGKYISSTVRVGFVPINYDADGMLSGAAGTGEDWAHAVIWEPNSSVHLPSTYGGTSPAGKQAALAVKGLTLADTQAQVAYDWGAGNTGSARVTNGAASTTNTIALFNLCKDTKQQFAVYIWVEGTDLDTENAVAKNAFSTFLKFGQDYNAYVGASGSYSYS